MYIFHKRLEELLSHYVLAVYVQWTMLISMSAFSGFSAISTSHLEQNIKPSAIFDYSVALENGIELGAFCDAGCLDIMS